MFSSGQVPSFLVDELYAFASNIGQHAGGKILRPLKWLVRGGGHAGRSCTGPRVSRREKNLEIVEMNDPGLRTYAGKAEADSPVL
jgi:hypothetical protein